MPLPIIIMTVTGSSPRASPKMSRRIELIIRYPFGTINISTPLPMLYKFPNYHRLSDDMVLAGCRYFQSSDAEFKNMLIRPTAD